MLTSMCVGAHRGALGFKYTGCMPEGVRGADCAVRRALGLQGLPALGFLAEGDNPAHGLLAGQGQNGKRLGAIQGVSSAVSSLRQCRVKGYR
mgnify:CR=1 FL=1